MSTQELTKTAIKYQKTTNPYSLISALKNGGPMVWLSCIVMGLGNLLAGQYIKGALFLAIEAIGIYFIATFGITWIPQLGGLGSVATTEVWDDNIFAYVTVHGDKSQLILLYGIAAICVIVVLLIIWQATVRSGYMALSAKKANKHVNSFVEDIKDLFDKNVHKTLMILPTICLFVFTVIPLIYMMSMAFTNYSKLDNHLVLFDWVGLDNFKSLFNSSTNIGKQFGEVLGWTIVWAIFATFLNFILGTIVAIIINRPTTRLKGLWRGLLSLTIAVPQFVSLMIINSMLQDQGIINRTLISWGILEAGQELPFLQNATWARVTVIVVNLWVGIPYTIMQVTGILKNIPSDLYEAARLDGANSVQQFRNITLPYMLFVLTPYMITQFTGNINNFNVIYLTTRGLPIGVGDTAGATDLLVTWLYKLSVDKQYYNIAAIIGIFTFVVLSIVSLVTYRSTGSYKDEEGFK